MVQLKCFPIEREYLTVVKKIDLKYIEHQSNIMYCNKSNIAFLDPCPSEYEYGNFYKEEYWQKQGDDQYFEQKKSERKSTDRSTRLFSLLELSKDFSNKKYNNILDVGCGYGGIAEWFAKRFETTVDVIEPSEHCREVVQKKTRLKIVGSNIDEITHLKNVYDIILLSHVLEHSAEPDIFVYKITKLLRIGGMLLVEVPNLSAGSLPRFNHPFAFTARGIFILFNKFGLEVENYYDGPQINYSYPYLTLSAIKIADEAIEQSAPLALSWDEQCQLIKRKRQYLSGSYQGSLKNKINILLYSCKQTFFEMIKRWLIIAKRD